jgi:hypothetical protein
MDGRAARGSAQSSSSWSGPVQVRARERRVRAVWLLWVDQRCDLQGVEAEVTEVAVELGVIESRAAGGFPGPAGGYRLLAEELGRTMVPQHPLPVFLHESYEAQLEKWVNSLPDAAAEVAIVARVRDAVMRLVETRLAADPQAFSASPTVTTTEPTQAGMAVVGRSVVLRPARPLRRPQPGPAGRQLPGEPRP